VAAGLGGGGGGSAPAGSWQDPLLQEREDRKKPTVINHIVDNMRLRRDAIWLFSHQQVSGKREKNADTRRALTFILWHFGPPLHSRGHAARGHTTPDNNGTRIEN